jgi:hypothetical protein
MALRRRLVDTTPGVTTRDLESHGSLRRDCVAGCEDVSFWDLFQGGDLRARSAAGGPTDGGAPQRRGADVVLGHRRQRHPARRLPDNVTSWTGHEFTFPLSTFFGDSIGPPVYVTVDVTVEVWYTP